MVAPRLLEETVVKAGMVGVAVLVLVSGCGKKDETTTTVVPGVSVTTSKTGGTETSTVNLGGQTIVSTSGDAGMKAPADLPAWAPVYPGGKVTSTMAGMGGEGSKIVSMETADDTTKVAAFYDARIAAAGIKPAMATDSPEASMRMIPGKDDDSSGMLMIKKRDNGAAGADVMVTYGTK